MRAATLTGLLAVTMAARCGFAADEQENVGHRQQFAELVPVLQTFCHDCHSTSEQAGDLDLERFSSFADVQQDLATWRKVIEMVEAGEMPPDDQPQLSEAERLRLTRWSQELIDTAIRARAGDPGRVVLRRLNRSEYTYTVRDLTGVQFDPAREFPVDGAAGEGFTNTGDALAMSPALVQKYLAAGKEIASHAVLLPDGFRFSAETTRRDWADEILQQIRLIYARHTSGQSDTSLLDQWRADPSKSTENDGRIDLTRYFRVLVDRRDELLSSRDCLTEELAETENVNLKYLRRLAELMIADDSGSALLSELRRRWRRATAEDVSALVAYVGQWQEQLWSFHPVGHLGLVQRWQQPNDPQPNSLKLRHAFASSNKSAKPNEQPAENTRAADKVLRLIVTDAGDGSAGDQVVLHQPRIEFKNRPGILLRDVPVITRSIQQAISVETARTDQYLSAIDELPESTQTIKQLAEERDLDANLLAGWAEYLGIRGQTTPVISGHFAKRLSHVGGHEALNGWATDDLPVLLANRSEAPIRHTTLTVPAGAVTVHPAPQQEVVVAWQSPLDGHVRIEGKVADTDDQCGNGVAWRVEGQFKGATKVLASGSIDNAGEQTFALTTPLRVRPGDTFFLVVNARDQDHVCDTTHIEWTIHETNSGDPDRAVTVSDQRVWDLAADTVPDLLAANPQADAHGHPEVWHFLVRKPTPVPVPADAVPRDSVLDRWRTAVLQRQSPEQRSRLAAAVRDALTAENGQELSAPDRVLQEQLTRWNGPLEWTVGLDLRCQPIRQRGERAATPGNSRAGHHAVRHPSNRLRASC